jgi:uncharacterized protein (TIGR02001 family)
MKFVSKTILSTAMIGLMSGSVLAAPEKIGDFELSGNMVVVSDYVWRGVSQTYKKPAIQGSFELAHPIGVYLGTFLSNVRFVPKGAPSDGASLEMDYYGGYRYEYSKGNTIDVGAYRYNYPGAVTAYNFTEVYVKGNYDFLTASYNYSNKFFNDAGKAHYFTVGASYPLPDNNIPVLKDVTLSANIGRSQFKDSSSSNYTDWSVGLSKDFAGLSFALTYTDTNVDSAKDPDKLAKSKLLLGVSKKF